MEIEEDGDVPGGESSISAPAQTANHPGSLTDGDVEPSGNPTPVDMALEHDDTALDISMETEEDEVAMPGAHVEAQATTLALEAPNETLTTGVEIQSRKRKSHDQSLESDEPEATSTSESHKKVKLAGSAQLLPKPAVSTALQGEGLSLLPPELWHHIFTYCPPKTLGNLLRVNKLFNLYLDPSSLFHSPLPASPSKSIVDILKPNAVWQASRRLFWPKMPAPLRSKTEHEMWRLLSAVRCENCNKLGVPDPRVSADDPWHAGPGPDGVAAVWPFAAALCGSCLLLKAVKEIDLLFSSSIPSTVIPALPFVFLTQEFHIVAPVTIDQGQPRTDLKVTKIFLSADVAEIQTELDSVRRMGPGALEEWLKGLEGRGSSLLQEAAKWQRWEAAQELRQRRIPSDGSAFPTTSNLPPQAQGSPAVGGETVSNAQDSVTPPNSLVPRHPKSQQEAALLKSARAAEIERRCQLLAPPLPPNILRHIPAFQAAIQITQPLDDCAWDVLKPRLLAQRAEAEKREQETPAEGKAAVEDKAEEPRRLESTLATTKEARDLVDKQWEEVQEPLRARIVGYADEFVQDDWDNGRKVSRENCSRFAAEALLYIRRRFYADTAADLATANAAGKPLAPDPPQGPFTQKLTLENMKWIFDSKLKPFTEPHRKELFFCNACEGNAKGYGFEGVVQHYAAKHTSALSLGSIVVHWRAEWPETPPFNPEGRCRKPSASTARNTGGYHGYQPMPGPMPTHLPPFPPHSASGYGAPVYGDQYHPPPQQYPPEGPYPASNGYGSHHYPPQPGSYLPYQQSPVPNGPYPPPPMGADPSQTHQPGYPPPPSVPTPMPSVPPSVPAPYNYNYSSYQTNNQAGLPPPPASGFSPYPTQLEFVAKNSREVWQALSNIKDLPGSARVFATIHHVVKRYRSRFSDIPSLGMFIDGLSNNKDMRPVRNINGLTCKACELGLGNAASVEKEARGVSFPKLTNHFQSKHIELIQQTAPHLPPLDWVNDMVLLEDHYAISNLRSAVASDSQKFYLLSDAFPDAFNQPQQAPTPYQQPQQASYQPQPQQTPYQPQPQYVDRYLPPSTDNHDRFYAAPGTHGGQDGRNTAEGSHYVASQPLPQKHDYEPKASTPGHELNRQKGSHQNYRKGGGKNKGKNSKAAEAARRQTEEEDKRAEEEARREEDEIRAMWATDRAVAARAATSSAKPEDSRPSHLVLANFSSNSSTTRTNTPQQQHHKVSSQKPTPHTMAKEAPNLMAALEMHLDQGHPSAPANPQQPENRTTRQGGDPRLTRSAEHRPVAVGPPGLTRYGNDADHSKSPTHGERHWKADPPQPPNHRVLQGISSPALQPNNAYYDRPTAPYDGRGDPRYERRTEPDPSPYRQAAHPSDVSTYEQPHERYPPTQHHHNPPPERHALREEIHYDRAPPRPEAIAYARAPRPEYYPQHPEDARPPPRGAVQEFEIVQVIDDQGEYFIRRPVIRREAEPYYYEDRGPVRREPEPYPRYEPVYARGPPPSAGYEAMAAHAPREEALRPAPRRESNAAHVNRADPAYYEPYDPHNPTAAVPVTRPQAQPQPQPQRQHQTQHQRQHQRQHQHQREPQHQTQHQPQHQTQHQPQYRRQQVYYGD